jgi:hypothetical protein
MWAVVLAIWNRTCTPELPLLVLGGRWDVDRADQYRNYAAECLRVARQATNAGDKAMLLEMAQKWRELAERLQQRNEQS